MKIRKSFVTNSSSSSYVVAKKKDASEKDVKKAIADKYYKNKDYYLSLLKNIEDDLEETGYTQETEDYYGERSLIRAYFGDGDIDKEYINYLTKKVLELFSDTWNGKGTLDSWEVTVCEVSNENDDIFEWLLYDDSSIIQNELIKVI